MNHAGSDKSTAVVGVARGERWQGGRAEGARLKIFFAESTDVMHGILPPNLSTGVFFFF